MASTIKFEIEHPFDAIPTVTIEITVVPTSDGKVAISDVASNVEMAEAISALEYVHRAMHDGVEIMATKALESLLGPIPTTVN